MFGKCKAITRSTSNQHSDHVIPNIMIRIQEEQKAHSSTLANLKAQESEVHKRALVLGPKNNYNQSMAHSQCSTLLSTS